MRLSVLTSPRGPRRQTGRQGLGRAGVAPRSGTPRPWWTRGVSATGGAHGTGPACPRGEDMGQTVAPLVPVDRHGFTASWLTSALRSTGAIAPGTRVSACAQHPVVAVSASGEARDDGGGLSGPQLVRLKLAYE